MKKEELIKSFKEAYLNDVDRLIDENELNDIAETFVEEVPVDLDLITQVFEIPYFETYNDLEDYEIYIETVKANCVVYFTYKRKPQRVVLRQVFKNALDSWYKWSGNPTYNYAYLKDDKVYLYYEQYEDKELYEELQNCRETIIATMLDCSKDLWNKKNVKRWNEYQQYIAPILIALDFIEEGVKVYE